MDNPIIRHIFTITNDNAMNYTFIAKLFQFANKYGIDLSTEADIKILLGEMKLLTSMCDVEVTNRVSFLKSKTGITIVEALEVVASIDNGAKLGAVKMLKTYGGLSLRDAKDIVDEVAQMPKD